MAIVPIKSRPDKHILMDDEVADVIGDWGWRIRPEGGAIAYIPNSKGKNALCHRAVKWVMNGEWPDPKMDIDHINHNKLDNQDCNLRIVTHSINCRNRLPFKGCASKFKGVSWRKTRSPWTGRVVIRRNNKNIVITSSSTKDERIAAMCYDCMTHLIGGFLLPNFPDMTFKDKWEAIGESQREQIMHSLEINNFSIDRRTLSLAA